MPHHYFIPSNTPDSVRSLAITFLKIKDTVLAVGKFEFWLNTMKVGVILRDRKGYLKNAAMLFTK